MIGPHLQTLRKSIPSLDWLPITGGSFQTLRNGLGLCTHWSFQLQHNTRSKRVSLRKATYRSLNGLKSARQALISALILTYPDYSKAFILETDASLKGLGTVLSQRGDDGMVRVIAYASRSLRPGEKSMWDYSSTKIELLALKWSVCEKFKDYLLGSKFMVYTDNNPLVYVKTSKLGVAQIRWLSELALYDFDIVYHTGKSNLVTDALSWRPESPSSNIRGGRGRKTAMKSGKQYPIPSLTPGNFTVTTTPYQVRLFFKN